MHIISKSVLMLFTKKIINMSLWLSKVQLAKVGAFFFETQCMSVSRTVSKILSVK